MKYKQIRSGRGSWAVFRDDKHPQLDISYRVPIELWALTADGDLVALVLNKEGLRDASAFSNFSHYEGKG